MLKKFIFSLTAVMALSLVVMAQEGNATATLTGHIVDVACATGKVAKQSDQQAAAANENRGCILMKSCLDSGLGVYSAGKFTKFDPKGVSLAKAALEKSKKDKGAKFKVTGKVTGDKMEVESITEVE
jgi:type 1 fimbria pilin